MLMRLLIRSSAAQAVELRGASARLLMPMVWPAARCSMQMVAKRVRGMMSPSAHRRRGLWEMLAGICLLLVRKSKLRKLVYLEKWQIQPGRTMHPTVCAPSVGHQREYADSRPSRSPALLLCFWPRGVNVSVQGFFRFLDAICDLDTIFAHRWLGNLFCNFVLVGLESVGIGGSTGAACHLLLRLSSSKSVRAQFLPPQR
mmetsp:Transcript_75303/g.201121  ORF Transcript_75303/g.201121 Transcript_75303/m.201121 type:complete len:200 (+) Transcript_75303:466-1065(+)